MNLALNDSIQSKDPPIEIDLNQFCSEQYQKSYISTSAKVNKFPLRPAINMSLIILITFQVYMVITSRVYLRGSLIRTFLEFYAEEDNYPELFQGNAFYLGITNVSEIKENLIFTFEQMQNLKNSSFLEISLQKAEISIQVQYLQNLQSRERQNRFPIDPTEGIVKPFDMHNITSIQLFLIQVNLFKIYVKNITVKSDGFYQTYNHIVTYNFQDRLAVLVNFDFKIDDTTGLKNEGGIIDKPQASYIILVRLFYFVILVLAITSLYLNYSYIRQTMKVIFIQLGKQSIKRSSQINQQTILDVRKSISHEMIDSTESQSLVDSQDITSINDAVLQWIKVNRLTLNKLTFKHYFQIIEFDIMVSILSNVFTIIGSFYLFLGMDNQIIVGISCLASWMTIFKFLKQKRKLVLMYELIKLSISKVTFFFVEFFPVFLAYTLLGICLFPKVTFFCSLSNSVTTLVSLMMGDSIDMITDAIIEKSSTVIAILYIFSFVLMFMHAIHNTLTSLIKEAFILKKIDLVKEQKKKRNESDYVYLSEKKISAQQEKQKLPVLLSDSLKKNMIRIQNLKDSKKIELKIRKWMRIMEKLNFQQKWDVQEDTSLLQCEVYIQQLEKRQQKVRGAIVDMYGYGPYGHTRHEGQLQSIMTNG